MCSTRCLKYFVVFFNFVFLLLGVLLIGIGSWAEYKYGGYSDITSVNYIAATRLVIGVGVVIVITSLFGFCGAVTLNKCLLIFYIVVLLILLILELTGVVLGYVYSEQVKEQVRKDLLDGVFNKYAQDGQNGLTEALDKLQIEEKCCGIENYTNWFRSKFSANIDTKLPDSCCKVKSTNCANPLKSETLVFPKGCFEKLSDTVYDNLFIAGSICISLLIFQVVGTICAIVLVRSINKGKMSA